MASSKGPVVDAETIVEHGVAYAREGKLDWAIGNFRRAIALRPDLAKAHHNLGVALAQKGLPQEAVLSLCEALRLQPDYVDAHYNIGIVYDQLKRSDDAIASYRKALQLRVDYPEALNNLGLSLIHRGQSSEAVILLRQAIRLKANFLEGHNNLGLAYTELGAFRDADASFEQALRLDPRYGEGHSNLGNNFKEAGQLDEALACYDMALALQPSAVTPHWNRAIVLLQKGDYEKGWTEYEWRVRRAESTLPAFRQPLWDGSELHGKTILLHAEQGLGDALQFVRYAPLIKERGGTVIFACPEVLRTLVSRTPGIDRVISEKVELPPFDIHAPLLSLPMFLKTTLANIPSEVPYLFSDPALVDYWSKRLRAKKGFRVGICWQGNTRHRKDRQRSVPLVRFNAIAQVPGVSVISLQKGPGIEQLSAQSTSIFGPEERPNSDGAFDDTAALIMNLDLVITVDTSVAHLAGGLGAPVWILLPRSPDWRWLLDRSDSPWYPTARLFQQATWGDWDTVFAAVVAELRMLLLRRTMTVSTREI